MEILKKTADCFLKAMQTLQETMLLAISKLDQITSDGLSDKDPLHINVNRDTN